VPRNGEHPGTSLEIVPTIEQMHSPQKQLQLISMSLAGNPPLNWNLLTLEQDEETRAHRLSTLTPLGRRRLRGRAGALCAVPEPAGPRPADCLGEHDELAGGHAPAAGRSARSLSSVQTCALACGMEPPRARGVGRDFANYIVGDVQSPELEQFVGRRIGIWRPNATPTVRRPVATSPWPTGCTQA